MFRHFHLPNLYRLIASLHRLIASGRLIDFNRRYDLSIKSPSFNAFRTNRKRVRHFLLVVNSNLGPIWPRFRDRPLQVSGEERTHPIRPEF